MRNVIVSAALAAALLGCSSSSNSSSSGSTGTTGATAGTTGAATTGTGGSGSTTGTNSGTTTGATTTGGGSTGQTNGSGSSGSTGATTTGSTTGSSFCSPAGTSGSVADWTCVGSVTPPSGTGAVTVNLTLQDAVSKSALPGVPVKLCRRTDANCASPDATGTTDQSGSTSLTADIPVDGGNYDGYLQFDATDAGGSNSTMAQLAFVPPFASDLNYTLYGVTQGDAQLLGTFLNSLDPTKGQVIGNVADCTNTSAAGVVVGSSEVSPDGGTGSFYFSGGYPTATPPTDATGNFIITNVPAGTPTIYAAQASDCTPVGQMQVITRAGTITTAIITPQ